MAARPWRWIGWIALAVGVVLAIGGWQRLQADPQLAAGAMTVANRTSAAFEQPAAGLNRQELERHARADLRFDRAHVPLAEGAEAGLGPQFVANSCIACHVRNGRGRAVAGESLVRVVLRQGAGTAPVPGLGHQIQDQAVLGAEPEATVRLGWRQQPVPLRQPEVEIQTPAGVLPAAAVARSLRLAPPLVGLGLLEAVPEQAILALADPEDRDRDGISGRPHWLTEPGGSRQLGRFGWKAITASVRAQTAAAYLNDMGLTTPRDGTSETTTDGRRADISNEELALVTYYTQSLGAPRTGRPAGSRLVRQGQRLFGDLHCAGCHVPQLHTARAAGAEQGAAAVDVLAGQTIFPYTDLLLHDLGPGLDDGVAEREARSAEWRTAPLWGIGLTRRINPSATFLHDGRARSLEEAILWHGGEAAHCRDRYLALPRQERSQLLAWLGQL
jgi:CxxC motif-containing protein (DUF1111 family)